MQSSSLHPAPHTQPFFGDVSDAILQVLRSVGARHVFGVPGGAVEPLSNAIARASRRGELSLVVSRHEAGAAFMADGYFRETGVLGVCFATSGPGATNLLTGAASAMLERTPMLFITGQPALPKLGRRALQDSSCAEVDIVLMFSAVTKYSSMVTHPEQLLAKLATALSLAHEHPRGPVHLSIPPDVLSAPLPLGRLPAAVLLTGRLGTQTVFAESGSDLAATMQAAQRPLLLLGEFAEAAMGPLMDLLEVAPMPVVTSSAGKRWFPTTHPLYAGVFGFAGHHLAEEAVREADLVLAVGCGMRELCTNNWSAELMGAKLVQLGQTSIDLAAAPFAGMHCCGDLHATVERLARALGQARAGRPPETWFDRPFMQPKVDFPAGVLPLPSDVMARLAACLPRGTAVYVDAGNSWSWAIHYASIDERITRIQTAMGFGSMAWGIGAAVGAAFGARDSGTSIACITGDGAWMMSGLELTVAVEHRLPVVFVVLNDSGYGMVRHGQRMGGAEPIGHDLPSVDFALMARAAGARAVRVATRSELASLELESFAATHGPVVVEVLIDPEFSPPMATRVKSLALVRPA